MSSGKPPKNNTPESVCGKFRFLSGEFLTGWTGTVGPPSSPTGERGGGRARRRRDERLQKKGLRIPEEEREESESGGLL